MDEKFINENIDLLLEAKKKKSRVKHFVDGKEVDSNTAAEVENLEYAKEIIKQNKKNNKAQITENFSDYELLNLLEEQGFEVTYSNLCILKEGIANGSIILEAKEEVIEEPAEEIPTEEAPVEEIEEVPEEGTEEYAEQTVEGSAPRISISMPVDGSMQIDNCGKQIVADAEGNVNVSLAESRKILYAKNTERFLKSYLCEDCNMTVKSYEVLTEDTKVDSVKDIAVQLLQSVEQKILSIDTTPADRSRGDIKQLKELSALQDCITQLETIIERDENASLEYSAAVATIIKSILYMNQYSAVFKDAYRNKKTVMILKYQSLVLSIISSVTYLISTIIDFKSGEVKLKSISQDISEFAPLKSLESFVKSVDSGEFKTITNDVNTLREYYLEVPVETMSLVLESYEQIDMVVSGIKNIYNQLTTGDLGAKVTDILYKAIGVVVLLFSLRDVFYTLFRMRTRVSDMTNVINQFSNLNIGGNIVNKLAQFTNKFRVDAENGSDICKREIEEENKKVLGQVKQVQASNSIVRDDDFKPEELVNNPSIEKDSHIDFGFDF